MPNSATNTRRSRGESTVIKPGESIQGKQPPQSPELEESILGALMIEKDAYYSVADLLRPESFYYDKNRHIYEAIVSLATADEPIDAITVSERLKNMGMLQQVGGIAAISELTLRVTSAAHLRFHAQIVAQKAIARELITLSWQITEKAYDETQDVDELMQEAEAGVFGITQRSQARDLVQIDPVIEEAFARMRQAGKSGNNISGIPSGFTELDKVTGGWQKSELIIIAARPAMGKTAFVLSMAKNIVVNFQRPVAIFSLEMPKVQLANRLIMNVCEVQGDKVRNGNLTKQEYDQMDHRVCDLLGAPLYMDDTPGLSIFELYSKARKAVRERKVELIIIDYLQLMNARGANFGSREQEVSTISRMLKQLAKELDIPIIALSQLNRNNEKRGEGGSGEGKKPQLSDLRESGSIEQDADMVIFIHRPEYYHIYRDEQTGDDLRGIAEIIIGKNRSGATKDIRLRFVDKYARFQNTDEAYDQPTEELMTSTVSSRMNALPDNSDSAILDSNPDEPFF